MRLRGRAWWKRRAGDKGSEKPCGGLVETQWVPKLRAKADRNDAFGGQDGGEQRVHSNEQKKEQLVIWDMWLN